MCVRVLRIVKNVGSLWFVCKDVKAVEGYQPNEVIEEKAMSYSILDQENRRLDCLKLNVVKLNDA